MTFCRLIYVSDLTLVHISGLPLGLSSSDDGELLEYELEAEAAGVQPEASDNNVAIGLHELGWLQQYGEHRWLMTTA